MGFFGECVAVSSLNLIPSIQRLSKLKYKSAIQTPIIADVMNAYIQSWMYHLCEALQPLAKS